MALAALALSTTALGGGCGEDESEPPATAETALTITLDADGPGGAAPLEAKIECPGADAPQEACAAVEALPEDPTAPFPPATPCTQVYGGPDVVTLEGTLDGEEVEAKLTRADGCEIERFERFADLLDALFPDYEPGAALRR